MRRESKTPGLPASATMAAAVAFPTVPGLKKKLPRVSGTLARWRHKPNTSKPPGRTLSYAHPQTTADLRSQPRLALAHLVTAASLRPAKVAGSTARLRVPRPAPLVQRAVRLVPIHRTSGIWLL